MSNIDTYVVQKHRNDIPLFIPCLASDDFVSAIMNCEDQDVRFYKRIIADLDEEEPELYADTVLIKAILVEVYFTQKREQQIFFRVITNKDNVDLIEIDNITGIDTIDTATANELSGVVMGMLEDLFRGEQVISGLSNLVNARMRNDVDEYKSGRYAFQFGADIGDTIGVDFADLIGDAFTQALDGGYVEIGDGFSPEQIRNLKIKVKNLFLEIGIYSDDNSMGEIVEQIIRTRDLVSKDEVIRELKERINTLEEELKEQRRINQERRNMPPIRRTNNPYLMTPRQATISTARPNSDLVEDRRASPVRRTTPRDDDETNYGAMPRGRSRVDMNRLP